MKRQLKRSTNLRLSRRKKVLASAVAAVLMTSSSWMPVAEARYVWHAPTWWNWFGWWEWVPDPVSYVNPVPQVSAGSTNLGIGIGQPLNFSGSFTDGDNDGPYTYTWNFGDGNTATGIVAKVGSIPASHAYLQAGQFTATLEVIDRAKRKGSHQIQVTVATIDDDTCNPALITIRSKNPFGMWNTTLAWDKNRLPNAIDRVLIQSAHTVILPNTAINVRTICIEQNGTLQSALNNPLLSPTVANLSAGAIRNRGTIKGVWGSNSNGMDDKGVKCGQYTPATAGSDIRITAGRFVNETTGKIGLSRGGDDLPYIYCPINVRVDATGGDGGDIDIQAGEFVNQGLIDSGNGGNGDTFDSWGRYVHGDATGGNGGTVNINANNLAMSINAPTGQIKSGNGGLADGIYRWLVQNVVHNFQNVYWGGVHSVVYWISGWWDSGEMYDVVGGVGGNLTTNLGNISGLIQGGKGQEIKRDLYAGTNVYYEVWPDLWIDPTTLTMDETTRINQANRIVLFGGDDWTMDLRKLSPGAIQAEKTITLAVGKNSTIDLRGVTGKVFVAKEKVEIFADNVMLDDGVTLQDLADAPEIIQQPSKILYHVDLTNAEQVRGEPSTTLPVKLNVLNNGPTEDTYTVQVADNNGWQITPPPQQITVAGLRRTELTLEVALPSARGAEDELTVTVTSQNDPTATATTKIRVGVLEQELITPRTGQKADIAIIINNNFNMASLFQTVANALEQFLAAQPVNAPTDEEMVNFFSQFNENNLPTQSAVENYLSQFKTEPLPLPVIELITFTDNFTTRVVTNNLADLIGRIRSLQPQESDTCPDVSTETLSYALTNLNNNGQIILAVASSAEQALDADTQLKLQARNIKTHVLLAGTCENSEEADKRFYRTIANMTGGTFNWLPQGITSEAEIATTFSEVITNTVAKTTPSGGTVVPPPREYKASGTLQDELGNPIVGATVQLGGNMATTDSTGYWEIKGLPENSYKATFSKTGYSTITRNFELGNEQDAVITFKPRSLLKLGVVTTSPQINQGEDLSYTATIKNNGTLTATGVMLTELFPEGVNLVRLNTVEGPCDLTTQTCTLPDLAPGSSATVEIVVNAPSANEVKNAVAVFSNEYPPDMVLTQTTVIPYLSVSLSDNPDPMPLSLVQGEPLQYTATVTLDERATEIASGINLALNLPSGLMIKDISTENGTCTNQRSKINCLLTDLEVGASARVLINTQLRDLGLLTFTASAEVTANNYPTHQDRERTDIQIPPGIEVDMALVVDDTGSMQEEIDGIKKALQQFIATIDASQFPLIALVTFKDEAVVRFFGRDLNLLLKEIGNLKASGGGTCPEASVEALNAAILHIKQGGSILFVTDASPYDDADLEKLTELLQSKAIRLNSIVTGDCSDQNSWNDLEESQ